MIGETITDAYGFLAIASGAILLLIAGWTIKYQDEKGALPFIGILIASAGWSVFDGFISFSTTLFWKDTFLAFKNVFVFLLPVAWVLFSIQYTDKQEHWTPPIKFIVFGGSLFFISLSLTNSFHDVFISPTYLITEPVLQHGLERQPLYWAGYIYAYSLVIASNILLIRLGLSSGALHKKQIYLLTIGLLAPIIANVISELALFQFYNLTITPLGLGVWGLILAYVFHKHRLFNATPIARERVIHGLEDAVIVIDSKGRVTDWNPAAEPLFSDSPDAELVTKLVSDDLLNALAKIGVTFDDCEFNGVVGDGAGTVDEQVNNIPVTVNDEERIYNIRLSRIQTGGGKTQAHAIHLRDITELERKREELERQNERLDDFAGILAHDLRNPLSIAQGFSDLAEESNDPEHFEEVSTSLTRMEDMIDDVLTLARQGNKIQETEEVTLQDTIQDAWRVVNTYDGELELGLDTTVQADPTRLSNLFENLIRNAFEHVGEQTTITIKELENEPGFFVADDGPGIPAKQKDQVFEYGYTTNENGTGFGLNIVKEIVEAHGWSVSLGDDSDYGAKFEIRFNNTDPQE